MSGSDETRELGGLARSIDSLFERPDPAEQPTGREAATGSVQREAADPAEEPREDDSATPRDSTDADLATSEAADESPGDLPPLPAPEPEPLQPADSGAPRTDPASVAAASDALAAAVDEFLEGTPDAADRVAEAAIPLLDQYALDPLADAAEQLVRAAGDPPDERVMAVARSVMNPAVASKLVQRMGAEPEPGRGEYIVLAKRLGRIMAVALRGALTDATDRSARRAYYDALVAMGRTSRPIIEEMVDDDNRFLVRNAVAILGEVGGDRAVQLVTSALANTDPRVRREALQSLAKLGAEDADQLVVAHLEDSDRSVRAAAALAAGELKIERSLRHILNMLEAEQQAEARVPLLRALGQLGDPGAVPAIEKQAVGTLFSKPPTEVRVAAYRALHHIGTPHARELLEQAKDDRDPEVRSVVSELLRQ